MSDSSHSPELTKLINLQAKKIVCAVSGGLDSMLLLARCALHELPVVAAHVNYGKRGDESDADEQLVTDYCKGLGIPVFVHYAVESDLRGNFQEQARRVRYRFLEEVRKATGSDLIATAHHAGDARESMLMQLFRSGDTGVVRGIQQENRLVIRPMLQLQRDEILRLALAYHLPWREDASNADRGYTRNRLRHEIIPALDALFPGWHERLHQAALQNRQADELVARVLALSAKGNTLQLSALSEFSTHNRRKLLAAWIMKQVGFHPVRDVLRKLDQLPDRQKGRRIHIGGGFEVLREDDVLMLREKEEEAQHDAAFEVENPEMIPASGIGLPDWGIQLQTGNWLGSPAPNTLELRIEALTFPVQIRRWKAGDRLRPLGMNGSKLVSDVLTDQKIPAAFKKQALVLQSFDGVIGAVIFPRQQKGITGLIAGKLSSKSTSDKTLIIRHLY